ncbi:MAG: helix-turn-helix domain-containing protein [Terriglobia bacterium]
MQARYVLTAIRERARLRRMAKEMTVREMASKGGRARSKIYSKRQRKEWGKLGGRPPKLSETDWARIFYLLRAGKSQVECARAFKICTRTIGRALLKARKAARKRGK